MIGPPWNSSTGAWSSHLAGPHSPPPCASHNDRMYCYRTIFRSRLLCLTLHCALKKLCHSLCFTASHCSNAYLLAVRQQLPTCHAINLWAASALERIDNTGFRHGQPNGSQLAPARMDIAIAPGGGGGFCRASFNSRRLRCRVCLLHGLPTVPLAPAELGGLRGRSCAAQPQPQPQPVPQRHAEPTEAGLWGTAGGP